MISTLYGDNYLKHYGIKGMKWGKKIETVIREAVRDIGPDKPYDKGHEPLSKDEVDKRDITRIETEYDKNGNPIAKISYNKFGEVISRDEINVTKKVNDIPKKQLAKGKAIIDDLLNNNLSIRVGKNRKEIMRIGVREIFRKPLKNAWDRYNK